MRFPLRPPIAMLLSAMLFGAPGSAVAGGRLPSDAGLRAICHIVDQAAAANRLPSGLLARILWQESRLRDDATSPKGAAGVAQFMRLTADQRGLPDPRDTGPAIAAAARMVAELTLRFGNLGLAAAAYNAGSGRIAKWLRAAADLPVETRAYVRAVTGRSAEDWAEQARDAPAPLAIRNEACRDAIAGFVRAAPARRVLAAWQMRLDRSLARAFGLLAGEDRSPSIRAPPSRGAREFCDRIRALGAGCVLYAPPRWRAPLWLDVHAMNVICAGGESGAS